jgi:hypothetical protein
MAITYPEVRHKLIFAGSASYDVNYFDIKDVDYKLVFESDVDDKVMKITEFIRNISNTFAVDYLS